ncbi:Dihydrodipicolinate synthase [Coemansia sp. S16]|nr:Dihydrodipicolinate synthase [Coemansia sp. S3946]KAJ2047614.1 Dihydrodipicolinate synthase [Coemansia sp. S16]KAJ2345434.1 Dihydrodipicolinate synthase [Coemansia sp. RSA 2673]
MSHATIATATATAVEAASTAAAEVTRQGAPVVSQFFRSLVPDPTSPVQLVLLGLAGYFAVRSALASRSKGPEKFAMGNVQETVVPTKRDFTPEELAECDGHDEETALHIAVRRVVYDVSKARGFYGPEGPYANFAGRDASRGLALGKFNTDILTDIDDPIDTLEDLDKADNEALDEWATFFAGKYVPVGRLVDAPMTPERVARAEKKAAAKEAAEKEAAEKAAAAKEAAEKEAAEKKEAAAKEAAEKEAAAAAAKEEEVANTESKEETANTESKKDI